MPTFTDKKNRVWDVTLTLGATERIDAVDYKTPGFYQEDFSFNNPDQALLEAIYGKPSFLFAIIWAVVHPQVPTVMAEYLSSFGLTNEQLAQWGKSTFPADIYEAAQLDFIENIHGKAVKEGRAAFMEAIEDFFPDLKTVLSTLNKQWTRLQKQVALDLESVEPEIEKALDKEREQALARFRAELNDLTPAETPGVKSTA